MRGEGVEVSLNFFPVSRKSDFFFMRLPVGSVVFVSHRLKRAVFRVCRVLWKKYLATNVAGKIFSPNLKRLDLANPLRTRNYLCLLK